MSARSDPSVRRSSPSDLGRPPQPQRPLTARDSRTAAVTLKAETPRASLLSASELRSNDVEAAVYTPQAKVPPTTSPPTNGPTRGNTHVATTRNQPLQPEPPPPPPLRQRSSRLSYTPPPAVGPIAAQGSGGWLRPLVFAVGGISLGYAARAVQDVVTECGDDKGYGFRVASHAASGMLQWATTSTAGGQACADGLFLPGPSPTPMNVFFYMTLLLWSFVGVAIGADVFMVAIEMITSQEKTVLRQVGGVHREFTVLVWNATVSNLTLMALGSSAPEILLSVIEIASSGFYAGELGPSTIVGSAAFNLLVISAICVVAIPSGEGRFIKERSVFYVTAFFSVAAYLWILFILMANSPNVVEVWEGVVTFLLFPFLVHLAYLADQGVCSVSDQGEASAKVVAVARNGRSVAMDDALFAYESDLSEDQQAAKLAELLGKQKSRAYYRVNAVRGGTGGKVVYDRAAGAKAGKGGASAVFQFRKKHLILPQGHKWVDVKVMRSGNSAIAASVQYRSVGHSENGESRSEGTVELASGQTESFVRMAVDGSESAFYLVLVEPSAGASLGEQWSCSVIVEQTNSPGMLKFEREKLTIKESARWLDVTVRREGGSTGAVTFKLRTKDVDAFAGTDYVGIDTEVYMAHKQYTHTFPVHVMNDDAYENDETFQIVISDPTGGATFDPTTDGGAEKAVATVTIVSDEAVRKKVDQLAAMVHINSDGLSLTAGSWLGQFRESVEYEGDATVVGVLMYLIALPWKVCFALTPPARLAGGWLSFFVTLCFLGLLTALIGDLAAHMGCSMGLLPSITAITFVALGTSLPDTFASKSAAVNEQHADASIGNVTGSNSVNVFLGLGLPWMAAAIYWAYFASPAAEASWRARYKSEPWYTSSMPVGFVVVADDLGFSVTVFSACAIVCLGTLMLRRASLGFELGGDTRLAILTALFFVFLWLVYIGASVAYTYGVV